MTDKLREARIAEALRRAMLPQPATSAILTGSALANLAGLIEQDWRPEPEPEVDAVTLAFREWLKKQRPEFARAFLAKLKPADAPSPVTATGGELGHGRNT